MFARNIRTRQTQRHDVLQLIAKPERSAYLVESGASPDPTPQGLIEQPAICHDVQPTVRRFHLNRAENTLPMFAYLLENHIQIGLSVFVYESDGVGPSRTLTE